jgi:hypothetical protein
VPNEGIINIGLKLERKLLQRLAFGEHALLEAPPNSLLKTIIDAS